MMMSNQRAKAGVLGGVIAILIITVFELPPPIGIESRPQTEVSLLWLGLFLIILATEIATMIFIFRKPKLGKKLGITAGVLNMVQVAADQAHLMQPDAIPLEYSILEGLAVAASVALIYFSLKTKD